MKYKIFQQLITAFTGALMALAIFWLAPNASAALNLGAGNTTPRVIADTLLAETRVLSYQGRLLNPQTLQPQPDGAYSIKFSLYNVEAGGSALWSETKSVTVSKGLFASLLGDTTTLNLANFNGQNLWLGVKVGTDAEATPRQRVSHVAYALHADVASLADQATNATNANFATNAGTATNATNATNAGFATNAGTATNATNATNADFATNAGTAANATNAANADFATSASTAANATNADFATSAGTATNATSADYAINAGTATNAANANNSALFNGHSYSEFYKGTEATQVTSTLGVGGNHYWFSFGYSADQLIYWRVKPTTAGGKLSLSVETELGGDGTLTYWLRVTNVGAITSGYQLIRHHFSR